MRIVIDTNVLFSALYRPDSPPGDLLMLAIEGELELFAPQTVRAEIERALTDKLHYGPADLIATVSSFPVEWIDEPLYRSKMGIALSSIRDASDAPVVAVALVVKAQIVSGDKDFHPLLKKVVRTWKPKGLLLRKRRSGARVRGPKPPTEGT